MDKQACETIHQKIESEKRSEELQKLWHQINRVELRSKFIKKHEQNIALEKKSGVKKKYVTITPSMNQDPVA